MRRLLYVPLVHEEADMGSVGPALERTGALAVGECRWSLHRSVVSRYWESVRTYLLGLDCTRLRIYQDGLPVGGEVGRRVVDEATRRGSSNYRLIQELLDRGAGLRKTEDPVLLWRERENLLELDRGPSSVERQRDSRRDWSQTGLLTEERDAYIAETINATLGEDEIGVLLIGVYHDVAPRLAADIAVEMVRDMTKVSAYFRELVQGADDRQFEELARCMTSPVKNELLMDNLCGTISCE